MKKSLSALLSVAMSVSIFASAAFGADGNLDTQGKYDALVKEGIFEGMEDGQAHLDQTMTRAQLAKILTLVFKLSQDASASSVYKDLTGAGWAAGYIGAVTKAGLMEGHGDGVFAPSGEVTLEQLAAVLVRAFKLQEDSSGVTGTVSPWAAGYVGAAIKAGLIQAKDDYTKPALRSDLVESTYTSWQRYLEQTETTAKFDAAGAKKLRATFSKAVDTEKVTFEVTRDGVTTNPNKITWSDDKKTAVLEYNTNLVKGEYTIVAKGAASKDLSGKVSIEDERVAKIEIASDTAPSVRDENYQIEKVYVYYKVYNQYNEDVTKTSSVSWSSSIGPVSDDPTNSRVEIDIPQGNYYYQIGTQFTINGWISGSDVSINKTMKIGDVARASSVEVKQLYSADGKTLNVGLKDYSGFYLLLDVKDQYGNPVKAEKLNGPQGELSVYSSNPALVDVRYASTNSYPEFFDNVGPDGNDLGLQLVKNENMGLAQEGKATITFSPKYGGQVTTYDIEVKKGAIVKDFKLLPPTKTVSAGETVTIPYSAIDYDGNPVTDYDALVDSNINGVQLSGLSSSDLRWEKDPADNKKGVIKMKAPDRTGDVYLHAYAKASGQTSQLVINVKEGKVPAAVTTLDTKTGLAVGAHLEIKGEKIKTDDQFGHAMTIDDASFFRNYSYKVELINSGGVKMYKNNVSEDTYATVAYIVSKSDSIKLYAENRNTTTATLKVSVVNRDGSDVIIRNERTNNDTNYTLRSVKEFPIRVVNLNDIKTFEIADISHKLYDNIEQPQFSVNTKDVDVYGKLGDGTKIALPTNQYWVESQIKGVKVLPGDNIWNPYKVTTDGTGAQYATNQDTVKGTILVRINNDDGTLLTKEIEVSKATPVPTVLKIESKVANNAYLYKYEDNLLTASATQLSGVIAASGQTGLLGAVDVKDQYDVTRDRTGSVVITQASRPELNGKYSVGSSLPALQNGDSFTVTYTPGNGGLALTFRVHVDDPN